MARQTLLENGWRYVVDLDADLPVAQRLWALVTADLRDELTSFPVRTKIEATSDHPEFLAVATREGAVGLAGIPANVLSKLATQSYTAQLTVAVDGYIPDQKSFTIPMNPQFPSVFQPLDLGLWPLHRRPISIYGRANLVSAAELLPAPAAQVSVTKIWLLVPPPNLNVPPDAFEIASLQPGLYAGRPAGGGVRQQQMNPVASTFKPLRHPRAGDSSIMLSNTVGLAAGQILGFDRLDPERSEFVAITAITGATGPNEPATVQLRFRLAFEHRTVENMALGAPGQADTTGVAAIPADVALLANSLAGISSGDVVEITGGASGAEYHRLARFTVPCDARGSFRLPPLSRVAQLEIRADDSVHKPDIHLVIPDYRQEEGRVDFVLR